MIEQEMMIDLSAWKVSQTFDKRMKLCLQLGLIETLQHGQYDYVRLTQKGVNVFQTLMHLAKCAALAEIDPENKLKGS